MPTYEQTVADITPFDEERVRRYKEMLNEVNNFFAKEAVDALEATIKNWKSQSKNLRSLAQSAHGHNKGEDNEESEWYSL